MTRPMSTANLLFSLEGRINRAKWWGYFIPYLTIYVVLLLVGMRTGHIAIPLIYALLALYPTIAVNVKRCHDRGRSGWFILLAFVPIVSLWYLVEACILSGTDGPNEYGADPREAEPTAWARHLSAQSIFIAVAGLSAGILAGVIVYPRLPAVKQAKMREEIDRNLRRMVSAAEDAFIETGKAEFSAKELFERQTKLSTMAPVDGEDYSALTIKITQPTTITSRSGMSVTVTDRILLEQFQSKQAEVLAAKEAAEKRLASTRLNERLNVRENNQEAAKQEAEQISREVVERSGLKIVAMNSRRESAGITVIVRCEATQDRSRTSDLIRQCEREIAAHPKIQTLFSETVLTGLTSAPNNQFGFTFFMRFHKGMP